MDRIDEGGITGIDKINETEWIADILKRFQVIDEKLSNKSMSTADLVAIGKELEELGKMISDVLEEENGSEELKGKVKELQALIGYLQGCCK